MVGVCRAAGVALLALGLTALGGCGGSSSSGGGATTSPAGTTTASPSVASSTPAPAATATPVAAGQNGCALATEAEISAAVGTTLKATKQIKVKLTPNIVAHTGCLWLAGTTSAGFDANTLASSFNPGAAIAKVYAARKAAGAKQVSIGGSTGFEVGLGALQLAAFSKGQIDVTVSVSNGKPGAAVAIADLLAGRL
jgi:hypothetical protein